MTQFGRTKETLREKYLFQSEISCVKASHAMWFRKNHNCGSERVYKSKQAQKSEHVNVINVFHDVNSVTYTVNKFTLKLTMFLVVKPQPYSP